MSQPAWSGLADRFADLAAEREFDLWLYSLAVHHHPPGITDGEMRFMSASHLVRERTEFSGLALTGSPKLTGDEFLQLNRFRWLTWAAGRLLSSTSARPELEWVVTVHHENRDLGEPGEGGCLLRNVVATSAATTRRLAEGGCPSVRPLRDPTGGLHPGSWQQPLLSLRDAFWNHANARFDFHLELHGYTNPGPFGRGGAQLRQLQEHYARAGQGINTQESPQLMYWTAPDPGGTYTELAQHAGRQLPDRFIAPVRLLPPGVKPVRADERPEPLVAWSEFLWLANRQNYQLCGDSEDPGARKAIWRGGSPFMASALAIDEFIRNFGEDTVNQLDRRMAEVCPWFSGSEDRAAAVGAINAAFQPLPSPKSPPPTVSTSEMSTPNSEPYTLHDIRVLLQYQRAQADFEDWCRRTYKPVLSPTEVGPRAQAMALNCPQPGRLTLDQAVGQTVYRRLVKAAFDEFGANLDEPTLLYFVGEVASRHQRKVDEMWPLSLDEFGRLMDSSAGDPKTGQAAKAGSKHADRKVEAAKRGPKGRSAEQVKTDIKLYEDYTASGLTKEEFIRKRFREAEFADMLTRLETGRKDHAARERQARIDGD